MIRAALKAPYVIIVVALAVVVIGVVVVAFLRISHGLVAAGKRIASRVLPRYLSLPRADRQSAFKPTCARHPPCRSSVAPDVPMRWPQDVSVDLIEHALRLEQAGFASNQLFGMDNVDTEHVAQPST